MIFRIILFQLVGRVRRADVRHLSANNFRWTGKKKQYKLSIFFSICQLNNYEFINLFIGYRLQGNWLKREKQEQIQIHRLQNLKLIHEN